LSRKLLRIRGRIRGTAPDKHKWELQGAWSDSDYYSANEGEKQVRMDAEPTHNTLTLNFGTSANINPLQATFSFGVSTNTVPSHVANESPESTVS
jgi:hypothetical protein